MQNKTEIYILQRTFAEAHAMEKEAGKGKGRKERVRGRRKGGGGKSGEKGSKDLALEQVTEKDTWGSQ